MSAAQPIAPEPFPAPRLERRYRHAREASAWDFTRRDQRTIPRDVGHQVLSLLIDTINQLDALVMDGSDDAPAAVAHALATLAEAALLARYDASTGLRVDAGDTSVLVLQGCERGDLQAQLFASALTFLRKRDGREAPDPLKVTTR